MKEWSDFRIDAMNKVQ